MNLAPHWLYPAAPLPPPAPEATRTHWCADDLEEQERLESNQKAKQPNRSAKGERQERLMQLIERMGPVDYLDVMREFGMKASNALQVLFVLQQSGAIRRVSGAYKPMRYTIDSCVVAPPPPRSPLSRLGTVHAGCRPARVLAQIGRCGSVTAGGVGTLLGLPSNQAARVLFMMSRRGLIVRSGDRGRYRYSAPRSR